MAGVPASFACYDVEGKRCGGGSMSLPEYLDWMPIAAKIEYFRYIGAGEARTTHVLLKSQGEEQLSQVTLSPKTHNEYKELTNGAENHIDRYCVERGISRQPRNQ